MGVGVLCAVRHFPIYTLQIPQVLTFTRQGFCPYRSSLVPLKTKHDVGLLVRESAAVILGRTAVVSGSRNYFSQVVNFILGSIRWNHLEVVQVSWRPLLT